MISITVENLFAYSYFFSSMLFAVGRCNEPYTFKIEYILNIQWQYNDGKREQDERLRDEDEIEIQKICADARAHVVFDADSRENMTRLPSRPKPGKIVRKIGEKLSLIEQYEPILWCKFLPSLWLKTGAIQKEFIIFIADPYCVIQTELYKFEVSKIGFKPNPVLTDNPEDEELIKRDNRLQAGVGACAWRYICEEAKKYAGTLTKTDPQNNQFMRQLLLFNNDPREKHVTIICPGEPATYAFFGDSLYDVKIKILS